MDANTVAYQSTGVCWEIWIENTEKLSQKDIQKSR